jgi:pimeloyl-ACP methyl ester carboxylesterase
MALIAAYLDGAPVDDLRWLDDEKRRIWASDLREATASLDGYARDNVAWGAEWDIDITAVRCPVRIYHGANDKLVPPKHGRWLADRIAGAEFVSRPGAGHGTTSYGDWDFIFGPLRSALR